MQDSLILFIGAYVAEIAGTIAGFGSSSIFLPIANQVLSFESALLLVAIYHIFGNMSRLSMFWRHRNKRIFLLFGVPSILATIAGALLAGSIDPALLKIILGVVLFIYAGYALSGRSFDLGSSESLGRVGGALSGLSAGLIGTGGVLRGAFMSAYSLPKEQYIATIASIALLVDATRIPIYFGQGFLDSSLLWHVPVLFVIAFVGSRTGRQVVQYISAHTFRKIILIAVMIASVILILQGVG